MLEYFYDWISWLHIQKYKMMFKDIALVLCTAMALHLNKPTKFTHYQVCLSCKLASMHILVTLQCFIAFIVPCALPHLTAATVRIS